MGVGGVTHGGEGLKIRLRENMFGEEVNELQNYLYVRTLCAPSSSSLQKLYRNDVGNLEQLLCQSVCD